MPGMGDVFIVKYDSSGRWQWTTTWPTSEDDYAYSIATNGSALYVTGATDWETGFVKKFDTAGKEGWESLVAMGTLDIPQAVAVDKKTGNIYSAGHSFASMDEGDADAFVVQFSPSGKRLGAISFGTPWRDEIRSMVFDAPTSTLLVGGMVEDALPGNLWAGSGDAFVARIGTDLVLKWATQIGGKAFDQAHGVSVSTDGRIFAAGRVDSVFIPDDVHGDIFLAQFGPSGASQWLETWSSGGEDFANAVAANERSVFVCANTRGTLGQSAKGYSDLAIIRLDLE
jgi:hypothetical protein